MHDPVIQPDDECQTLIFRSQSISFFLSADPIVYFINDCPRSTPDD